MAFIYYNRTGYYGAKSTPTPAENPTASPIGSNLPRIGGGTVTIQNFAFTPQMLEIKAGQKVIWKHNDAVTHRVVSLDNLFDSGEMNRGDEFSFVFNKAGEYNYHCVIHPSMTGKIIVK